MRAGLARLDAEVESVLEAAAFFAVARFRRVRFGQLLYAADKVVGKWDDRGWMRHQGRERLFTLAAEASSLA